MAEEDRTYSLARNVWMSLATILSISGNILLIVVISRRQRFLNVTNAYNLNLSLSDLLKVFFIIPVYMVSADRRKWPFDLAACKALNVILYASFGVSVLTLMSLGFERYRLIIHPTKKQMTVKRALFWIVVTWIISLTLNMTHIPFLKLVPGKYGSICSTETSKESLISIIIIMTIICQVFPGMFFFVTYTLIIRKLRRDAKLVVPRELSSAARNRARRNVRAVKILVIESLSWVICLMPLLVYSLVEAVRSGKVVSPYALIYLIINCLFVLQTVVNPVVHFVFIKEFRNELRRMLNSLLKYFHCNQIEPRDYHGDETTAADND